MYSKTQSHSMKDFQIISKLGQGSFGQVFKVKYIPTSQTYALKKIKVFRITEKDRESALNQIRVLASCQHQNIIGYKGSFYDEASSSLCLVLQYAEQGDLARKIHKAKKQAKFISQSQIWNALVQLTLGIYSLHQNNIIHRDLKPANIFITADGTYKIGDLNICKIMKKQLTKTQTGTPYYVSPEIWKGKSYGSKVDIWSLGCIIYQMASKVPPFLGKDVNQLKHKVLKGTFPRISNHYSEQLSSLINSMLTQNPEFRPQPLQILINPVVIKKYEGQILLGQNKQKDKLLQTIKFHQRSWKKLNLPQSKYLKSQSTYNKQQIKNVNQNVGSNKFDSDRMKMLSCQRPGSAKPGRKSVAQIVKEKNRNNIQNYLLRNNKQAQKIEEIKKLTQQLRIKQRVVSAYGERPRIQSQQGKDEQQNKPSKKQQISKAPPLPPKAKVFSNRQNQVQKVNDPKLRPSNVVANKYQSSQTERSSKQNLKQAGQRILKSNSIYSQKQVDVNQILKTVKKLKS